MSDFYYRFTLSMFFCAEFSGNRRGDMLITFSPAKSKMSEERL